MGIKASKLKKRLRKKHRIGEFREFCFEVIVNLKPNLSLTDFDDFIDDFLTVVDKNKLGFGGGGDNQKWKGFVAASKSYTSPTEAQRKLVEIWLENCQVVESFKVENLIDAWHDVRWNS